MRFNLDFQTEKKIRHANRPFTKNRRAVSAIVSNLILIAAVVAVGFSVLVYANTQSNDYRTQYSQSVNSDINRIKETLAFEYAYYNLTSGNLTLYFMNSGTIGNVNITSLTIRSNSASNSSWSAIFTNVTMHYMVGGAATTALSVGQEGYVKAHVLLSSGSYKAQVTTWRGSVFEYAFGA